MQSSGSEQRCTFLSKRTDKWPLSATVFQDGFSRAKTIPHGIRRALWAIIYEPMKHVKFVGVKLTDLSLDLGFPSGCRGLGHMLSEVFLDTEI